MVVGMDDSINPLGPDIFQKSGCKNECKVDFEDIFWQQFRKNERKISKSVYTFNYWKLSGWVIYLHLYPTYNLNEKVEFRLCGLFWS